MDEWKTVVERMARWIEEHLDEPKLLESLSRQIGYSPTYCSTMFHRFAGMTIREYAMQRRLYHAAVAIRDTDARLIDVALDHGYSSHEALTAAFRTAYGVSPAEFRSKQLLIRLPLPLRLTEKQGGQTMLTEPNIRVEYIPAHRFLGVFRPDMIDDEHIWPGHDCDLVTHTVESLSEHADLIVAAHTAGWIIRGDQREYFYGLGVPCDYEGAIPKGFEIHDVPGGYYQLISHPPFDYPKDNVEVMQRVESRAFAEACAVKGFRWKLDGFCYQRHYPEGHGYMVLRPIERA